MQLSIKGQQWGYCGENLAADGLRAEDRQINEEDDGPTGLAEVATQVRDLD